MNSLYPKRFRGREGVASKKETGRLSKVSEETTTTGEFSSCSSFNPLFLPRGE